MLILIFFYIKRKKIDFFMKILKKLGPKMGYIYIYVYTIYKLIKYITIYKLKNSNFQFTYPK